ncbi:ABC transporter permease [Vulgatibacter sp.]|uniref:ABC transporter permease n=1 Tax=Vulgatibacter sp. TaxID=1971226 RepID=UPI0035679A51
MNQRLVGIASLASVTLAEALRDRILYGLVAFSFGLVALSVVLSNLTLGYRLRIVTDMSLSSVTFAGVVTATLLGITAISREVDRRLVFPVLAKPIERSTYIAGKFAGVLVTTWLNASLMMAAATVAIAVYADLEEGGRLFSWGDYALTWVMLLIRLGLVATIAVALSTFVSSTVALIGTIGVTVAGYLSSDLRYFMGQSESPVMRGIGEILYRMLPDFSLLDPLGRLVHGQAILTDSVLLGMAYAAAYGLVLLTVAGTIFAKRDLG